MKQLKWTLWISVLLIVSWNVISYSLDVRFRASIDEWQYLDSPDGRYTMAYGSAPNDWVWVQLRHKGADEVLADRWVKDYSREPHSASWNEGYVFYQGGGFNPVIHLPPIWLEKWFAKLP
jgi:hypothetical protein